MSDTPRTDALLEELATFPVVTINVPLREHARQLERELNGLIRQISDNADISGVETIAELRRKVSELEAEIKLNEMSDAHNG